MSVRWQYPIGELVFQPTTRCNLNCKYCYIPEAARRISKRPSDEVIDATARLISLGPFADPCTVVLHGGEPLVAGERFMRNLIERFRDGTSRRLQFSLQTNGTLLDTGWCRLFREEEVTVGVSLDDPSVNRRVDWKGRPSAEAAVTGFRLLAGHGFNPPVIAVVDPRHLPSPEEFLNFFGNLDVSSVGINIEEVEGANRGEGGRPDPRRLRDWWGALWAAWERRGYVPRVREFMALIGSGRPSSPTHQLWPTVDCAGYMTLLSPELSGLALPHNLFPELNLMSSFGECLAALGDPTSLPYVAAFASGVDMCRASCRHFSRCFGGFASNKYFDTGQLDVAEHEHCRLSVISLAEGVAAVG